MGKRIRVPDHDIQLGSAEMMLTQTRMFQRLMEIRQLGLAYLVYPSAGHSRGYHSLRCLEEAQRILAALEEHHGDISDDDRRAVRGAALLHDIGHIPFSHTLEDEHEILPKHDHAQRIELALGRLHDEISEREREAGPALEVIEAARPLLLAIAGGPEAEQDWRSDTVGNTVCADLLAYITTDAQWTGIEKRPGYYRIYEYFDRVDNRLCIRLTKGGLRNDIVSSIMDLLDMRYALTERVVVHHAKAVASAMLARAARLAGLEFTDELLDMGDERFLIHLSQLAASNGSEGAKRLVDGLTARRLHRRVFKVGVRARDAWDEGRDRSFCDTYRDGQEVERLLAEVENSAGLPIGSLAMWCPPAKSGMKLVRAHVVWDVGSGQRGPHELRDDMVAETFPEVGKRVRTIEDQYRGLWSCLVTLDRAHEHRVADVVRLLEQEMQIECDRTFADTYLVSIPGFSTGRARADAVEAVTRRIQERAKEELADQSKAALGGNADVVDEDDVLRTMRHVIDRELGAEPSPPSEADGTDQGELDLEPD